MRLDSIRLGLGQLYCRARLLLLALLLAGGAGRADNRPPVDIPALHEAQGQDAAIRAIDAQIQRGEWKAARDAAADVLERSRAVWHGDLQLALVRLAFAEAKLGQEDEALFHWQSLQALGGAELGAPFFRLLGPAAAKLAAQPTRGRDELPAGVVRAGEHSDLVGAQRTAGDVPDGNGGCTAARGPLWARYQVVVDAQGQPRQPAITGPSVCFSFAVLSAARRWRFAPARRAGTAVAAIYEETIHAPARRPLRELAAQAPGVGAAIDLLAAGKGAAAGPEIARQWNAVLDAGAPSRTAAVTWLALRAIALATRDDAEDQRRAGCLWEAAQGEESALYDAELAPFGAAAQRLEPHRWGHARAAGSPDAAPGEARTRPRVVPSSHHLPRQRFPASSYAANRVFIEAIVDSDGSVRDPLLVDRGDGMRGLDLETLDAVCGWRYEPATIGGRPIDILYVLGVSVSASAAPH